MKKSVSSLALLVTVVLGAGACVDPPPYVILTVEDPDGLATEADRLELMEERGDEPRRVPLEGQAFPFRITIDGFEAGEVELVWVDALQGDTLLASARARLDFGDGKGTEAFVRLAPVCNEASSVDCALSDGTGRGVCVGTTCTESFCGDGVVDTRIDPVTGEPFERCDDGNEDTQDDCPDGPIGTCEPAVCGDGLLYSRIAPDSDDTPEPCDDGNNDDEDGCRSVISGGERRCVINVCGDGVVNRAPGDDGLPTEECDDGNEIDEDACRIVVRDDVPRCVANVCGDGIVNRSLDPETGLPVEECDDGNDNPNDACGACRRPDWRPRVVVGQGDNIGLPTLQNGDISSLSLNLIGGITAGLDGELFIADQDNNLVWRFDPSTERVTRLAGIGIDTGFPAPNGADTEFGDGGSALRATIRPRGIATDGRFLYLANFAAQLNAFNQVELNGVFRLNLATGRIDLIAGRALDPEELPPDFESFEGDGRPATAALFDRPSDVAVTRDGTIFIADTFNQRVRAVVDGTVYTVAGTGNCGEISGDSVAATAADLCWVRGLAVGPDGRLYFTTEEPTEAAESEADACDDDVRDTAAGDQIWALSGTIAELIAGNGTLERVAGIGTDASCPSVDVGDGGPALDARLSAPQGLAFDGQGNLYVADLDHHRVRRIAAGSGTITTVAGTGSRGRNLAATAAGSALDRPRTVAVSGDALYIGEIDERLLRVDLGDGTIELLSGVPSNDALQGTNGRSLPLSTPRGVDFDSQGGLYFVDQSYGRVFRARAPDGFYPPTRVQVIAGSGGFSDFAQGFSGDGGPASAATLSQPMDVAVFESSTGERTIYVADAGNHRVRRVGPDGVIATVAGAGSEDLFELGNAQIPLVLIPDPSLESDELPDRVPQYPIPPADAAGPELAYPAHLAVASSAQAAGEPDVYVADFANLRLRRIAPSGTIETVAGDGDVEYDGPSGPSIGRVGGMAFAGGALYFVSGTLDGDDARFSLWRFDPAGDTLSELRHFELASDQYLNGLAASTALGTLELFISVDDPADPDDEDERILRYRPGANDGGGEVELYAGFARPDAPLTQAPQVAVDGVLATRSRLFSPGYLAIDPLGNLVVSDARRQRLRGIDRTNRVIDTVVGRAFPGDGEAPFARLGSPQVLAHDGDNRWLIGDDLGQPVVFPFVATLRQVELGNAQVPTTVETLVGQNNGYKLNYFASVLDQREIRAITRESLRDVGGIARDPSDGAVYFTEPTQHFLYRLNRPTDAPADWTLEFYTGYDVAATEPFPEGSASGPLDDATFRLPTGLALDPTNRLLYVADTGNHTVRVIDLELETVSDALAGVTGQPGFADGNLSEARFNRPTHLALACDGSLYVSDAGNRRVRRIDFSTSTVSTVLGTGQADNGGQYARADSLPVAEPGTLSVDRFGNLFVASREVIRAVEAGNDGSCPGGGSLATGEDLGFTLYGAPPRTGFPESETQCLSSVAADPTRPDRLFTQDACQGFFIELTR